ncbi:hypothetical protein MNBD_DELTA01-1189 [hydrothermal vent metagenome]|uniref:Uncharacterized protein n=1 Tax=hydrothermal vent metagenome TaxID=652676 RepID=A0A3B0RLV8_9ZZZZ
MFLKDSNIVRGLCGLYKGRFYLFACNVARVQDAPFGVPAFASEIELCVAVGRPFGKMDAKLYQLTYTLGAVLYYNGCYVFIGESCPGGQGIPDMRVKAIFLAPDRGYAALRVVGGALRDLSLGNDCYRTVPGGLKCEGKACYARAYYQKIKMYLQGLSPLGQRYYMIVYCEFPD